jgi:hypothetical protein
MAWGKVDDQLAFHPKVLFAGNEALGVWVRSLSYSCQMLTDGFVPSEIVEAFDGWNSALRLVQSGLWIQVDGGFQFHNWSDYQPSSVVVRERRESVREARRAAGRASGVSRQDSNKRTNGEQNDEQNTNPVPVPVPKEQNTPIREDVEALCFVLRDSMISNGLREPTITESWLRDARLLLDKDGIALEVALEVLHWSQSDSFWKSNILSIPTFRKHFDRLLLASQRQVESPESARRKRDLEESSKRRQRELERAEELRRAMEEQKEQAVPAPRCQHDRIMVVCDICTKELANERL